MVDFTKKKSKESPQSRSAKQIVEDRMQSLFENQEEVPELETRSSHSLMPDRHPQGDFFIIDIFNIVSYRLDLDSLSFPLFSLSTRPTTKQTLYEHNGVKVTIIPTVTGQATIHDKDIWIYAISKLMQAVYQGEKITQVVRFNISDYLKCTNRSTSGVDYERAKAALTRLRGTTITIESKNKTTRSAKAFGLIESFGVVEKKDGRMVRVEVKLPDWLFHSIINKDLRKISPDYFRLRKPLERRLYELACRHCNKNPEWNFSLVLLQKKCGSFSQLSLFRHNIKEIARSDHLPDYHIIYNTEQDVVTFVNRDPKIQSKANKEKIAALAGSLMKKMK